VFCRAEGFTEGSNLWQASLATSSSCNRCIHMFSGPVIPSVDYCSPDELLGCFASGVPTEAYADAAHRGHLRCLTFLRENDHEWHTRCCVYAAAGGHLSCLQYAHEQLQYAHQHGCWWDELTCEMAAATGHLACLEYAHQNGCAWDPQTICEYAVRGKHLDCLLYCYEHGGKLCLSSMHSTGSQQTTRGQSRVRLPAMNLAAIAEAEELYVKAFVASTFKHVCKSIAAEAIQLAWRKCFYSPDSLFCKKLKKDFDSRKQEGFFEI